jgi:hypothetical protein
VSDLAGLRRAAGAVLLGVMLPAAGVHAQGVVNVYEIPSHVSINVISNQLMHERLNQTLHHWDRYEAEQQQARSRPPVLPRARLTGSGIAELTQGLPRDQAKSAQAAYQQALDFHEAVIRKFGLPSGDLGVALASSIAGAWMAYNNKPFPDAYYLPLVSQMRRQIGSQDASLQGLTDSERTVIYEGLAVAGMLLASSQITWERNPRAPGAQALRERMRSQGGETLTRMLRVAPDKVAIGPTGVRAQP